MKMKREEFTGFRIFGEAEGRFTLKIRTVNDIDVQKRFVNLSECEVNDDQVTWKATVRGITPKKNVENEPTLSEL